MAVNIYPLPRLDELVELASGNKFYATLDFKDAYFQVMLYDNCRDITTLVMVCHSTDSKDSLLASAVVQLSNGKVIVNSD